MANLIRVVGVGPGNPDYITPAARKLIESADILVGGERLLRQFNDLSKEVFFIKNNLPEVAAFIRDRCRDSHLAVLASGDPAFYGILEFLKKHFDAAEMVVIPGLSSIQLACARLSISWHDAVFYSIHGREMKGLVDMVRANAKVIVLTDPGKTPDVIARALMAAGVENKKVMVCENLSYDNERTGIYRMDNVPGDIGRSGCVVVICDE